MHFLDRFVISQLINTLTTNHIVSSIFPFDTHKHRLFSEYLTCIIPFIRWIYRDYTGTNMRFHSFTTCNLDFLFLFCLTSPSRSPRNSTFLWYRYKAWHSFTSSYSFHRFFPRSLSVRYTPGKCSLSWSLWHDLIQ